MDSSIEPIPLTHLALSFVPVAIVIVLMVSWSLRPWNVLYATGRMLVQLMLIGYALVFIFQAEQSWMVLGVLSIMVVAASWIALNPVASQRKDLYPKVLLAVALGGGTTLAIVSQGVLTLDPWFKAEKMIPLAGMIFANCMNSVSLAAERMNSELERGEDYPDARRTALQTALIPITNSMFAVGLVSLPGMMTGQILSGVSPLIAVRYQIMVMCMLLGASGMATVCYLTLAKPRA